MRAILSIALLLGLSAPLLLFADVEPVATASISTAGLAKASVVTTSAIADPDNVLIRSVAMVVGVILFALAVYLAFGRKQRSMPSQEPNGE